MYSLHIKSLLSEILNGLYKYFFERTMYTDIMCVYVFLYQLYLNTHILLLQPPFQLWNGKGEGEDRHPLLPPTDSLSITNNTRSV